MKGSTVLSENVLTGLSIVISFILMALVVRLVLSYQAEASYDTLFQSIARDLALIIDRLASTSGSEKTEYQLPKGVHTDIRIDYKTVFVTYGDTTVKKSFSGLMNSGPYEFNDPTVLCFVKNEYIIEVFAGSCDESVVTSPPVSSTSTTIPSCDVNGGYLHNSLCWYLAGAGQSCDQVCEAHGSTCVESDWNDDDNCHVCEYLTGDSRCRVDQSVCDNERPRPGLTLIGDPLTEGCHVRRSGCSQVCSASNPDHQRICVCTF